MGVVQPSHAEQTLTEVRQLRNRARFRAHGGAWLPAAGIAALLLASIALYRYPFDERHTPLVGLGDPVGYPFWAGLPDPERSPLAAYLFWFIGMPLVLGTAGLWYRWRAGRVGLRVAWPLFVGTGLTVLLLLAVLASVPVQATDPSLTDLPPTWGMRAIMTPLLPVAAAVAVLGWAERSRALALAGGWIALLAVWQCGYGWGLGEIPGGQLVLLGIHRPGPTLIMMALPLAVFVAARGVRAFRAAR